MIWATLILVVLIAIPAFREFRRMPITHRQQNAPGQLAHLSVGKTHYQWFGPKNGPLVVCVHGLTTPSFVWSQIAHSLAAGGARVLTYDLYGRGYSDRPRGTQDAEFFIGQLQELLDNQGITERFTLIGYSMGGMIVPAFAARYPDQVEKIAIIAPAGMGHDLGKLSDLMANTPIIGDWLMHMVYPREFRRAAISDADAPATLTARQIDELAIRGFLRSVLGSLRGVIRHDMKPIHEKIAQERLPLLAIWAEADSVIPLKGHECLERWNPLAQQRFIANADHGVTYTHAQDVVAALTSWSASSERANDKA